MNLQAQQTQLNEAINDLIQQYALVNNTPLEVVYMALDDSRADAANNLQPAFPAD